MISCHPFSKKKFLSLSIKQQHKWAAKTLRIIFYSVNKQTRSESIYHYRMMSDCLALTGFEFACHEAISRRYHHHIKQACWSQKEHDFLSLNEKTDNLTTTPFQPIVIYLDQLRSAHNIGSIIRTNEGLRLGTICFSGDMADHRHPKVIKTSMGCSEAIPYMHAPIESLPRPLIGLEVVDQAIPVQSYNFPPTYTLVIGNEEFGISKKNRSIINDYVTITMFGGKRSLNVACAFAIVAHTIRQNCVKMWRY